MNTFADTLGEGVVPLTGELAINSLVLPKPGTYIIGGQQSFLDRDSSLSPIISCQGRIDTAAIPVSIPVSMSSIAPKGAVTITWNYYYVAETAPLTLTMTCSSVYLNQNQALPSQPFITAYAGGSITALQVSASTTQPSTGVTFPVTLAPVLK